MALAVPGNWTGAQMSHRSFVTDAVAFIVETARAHAFTVLVFTEIWKAFGAGLQLALASRSDAAQPGARVGHELDHAHLLRLEDQLRTLHAAQVALLRHLQHRRQGARFFEWSTRCRPTPG